MTAATPCSRRPHYELGILPRGGADGGGSEHECLAALPGAGVGLAAAAAAPAVLPGQTNARQREY